ncbi:hypothetical protein [Thauera sp. WH-1]|uniref:helix-turn-helix transcriptional regulator n=1 Tax=Thauera sp. WH-1 TaxID=3398230 RepID=UPI0039FC28A6
MLVRPPLRRQALPRFAEVPAHGPRYAFRSARRRALACGGLFLRELLAGQRDRQVGRALALLHAAPAHGWTIDELGRQVGLSRSALHERFVPFLGQPPMHYLASWRIQLGSRLLRETRLTVAAVAPTGTAIAELAASAARGSITP